MKRIGYRCIGLLLTLVLCAGLLPVLYAGAAESLEERQQAVVATALAYYDRGFYVQYDGNSIVSDIIREDGGRTRSTNQEPPEYATPNETLYSVCSDYCHQVYWDAFRYQLCGGAGSTATDNLVDPNYMKQVYLYDKESGKDVKEAIKEMFAMVQPGDILTTYSTAGHAMIYVGDVFGDGVKYLAHCYGTGIKTSSGKDAYEYRSYDPNIDWRFGINTYSDSGGGSIRLTPNAEEHFLKSYGKGNQKKISLVRPLTLEDMPAEKYPITPAAKYRMSHPRLSIERMLVDKTRFVSAEPGETLTLSLKLSNHSKQAYTVPVTEKIPEGVKLLKAPEGAKTEGSLIQWDVTLPAESEKSFTVSYEVTAARGATLDFSGGSVGDIASNVIPITVSGKKLTAEENAKLAAIAKGDYDALLREKKADGTTLGAVVWHDVLGMNVDFPTPAQVIDRLSEVRGGFSKDLTRRVMKTADKVEEADRFIYRMKVPMLHGGKQFWNEWGHERCNEPNDKCFEPGDVLFRLRDIAKPEEFETLVYLGGGRYLLYDAERQNPYAFVEETELPKCLGYQLFYCLRPTLAYDDVHTIGGAAAAPTPYKLPFTDVKESDWYFDYVRDLVREGTVNGMTATTFAPAGTLTYGQALKLIALAVGEKEPEKTGEHWASGYLKLALEKKWLSEEVNLDETITRAALCEIAASAKSLTSKPQVNPFTDTENGAVLALYRCGVINGMTATTFQPDSFLTRAQISKIVWQLRRIRTK